MVLDVSDVGVATSGATSAATTSSIRARASPTGLMSVTVVAEDLALADGYATAALVLGAEGPAWLAERSLARRSHLRRWHGSGHQRAPSATGSA